MATNSEICPETNKPHVYQKGRSQTSSTIQIIFCPCLAILSCFCSHAALGFNPYFEQRCGGKDMEGEKFEGETLCRDCGLTQQQSDLLATRPDLQVSKGGEQRVYEKAEAMTVGGR